MGTPLQIRDMPDEVLDALRAKASRRRLSLAAYAREVLERDARTPTLAEVLGAPGERATASGDEVVELIRADRLLH